MTTTTQTTDKPDGLPGPIKLLLNIGHAVDHMFLLIFATAVSTIAVEFGFTNWTELMPYGVGAFALFGLGALPAGRLGDLWSRRIMMIIFFFGMGIAALLVAATKNAWQLAAALTLLGAFAAIYHPVGIPMLVQGVPNPGAVIGLNGLVGNLGVTAAALVTGFLVQWIGWRTAFIVPGLVSIACGVAFMMVCPKETEAPSKRKGGKAKVTLSPQMLMRAFAVMTVASLVFSTGLPCLFDLRCTWLAYAGYKSLNRQSTCRAHATLPPSNGRLDDDLRYSTTVRNRPFSNAIKFGTSMCQ